MFEAGFEPRAANCQGFAKALSWINLVGKIDYSEIFALFDCYQSVVWVSWVYDNLVPYFSMIAVLADIAVRSKRTVPVWDKPNPSNHLDIFFTQFEKLQLLYMHIF